MRTPSLLAVTSCVACGRLSFDPVGGLGDAGQIIDGIEVVPHDEDGDGISDGGDVCPHLADAAQADGDGDGVGDICDPEPMTPRQRLAYFSSLANDPSAFTATFGTGTWTPRADSYHFAGDGFSQIEHRITLLDADIWVGADVLAVTAVGPAHQFAIVPDDAGSPPYYYSEVFQQDGQQSYVAVTEHDGTANGFTTRARQNAQIPNLELGAVTYHTSVRANPAAFGLNVTWAGRSYQITGATPTYVGSPYVHVSINALEVELRYLAIIETR